MTQHISGSFRRWMYSHCTEYICVSAIMLSIPTAAVHSGVFSCVCVCVCRCVCVCEHVCEWGGAGGYLCLFIKCNGPLSLSNRKAQIPSFSFPLFPPFFFPLLYSVFILSFLLFSSIFILSIPSSITLL